jgi:hypothetical protein
MLTCYPVQHKGALSVYFNDQLSYIQTIGSGLRLSIRTRKKEESPFHLIVAQKQTFAFTA